LKNTDLENNNLKLIDDKMNKDCCYCSKLLYSALALTNATWGSISPTYLLQAFTHADPKSAKIQSRNKSFAPLESVGIKVARKNICEIDP
jgi:hypothetical protein